MAQKPTPTPSTIVDAEAAAKRAQREVEKRNKFVDLANKRVPKALDAIGAIHALGNKNNYTSSPEHVDVIAKALEAEVVKTVKALRGEASAAVGFALTVAAPAAE